jgi:aconitate hydratase
VLTITEVLRKHGVVGKFVEFFGEGLRHLTIADRATLGNMCPEYGATVAIFPIDDMTLDYLRLTGRDDARVRLVEDYARAQGLFRTDDSPEAVYTETLELDLSIVEPSLAGPKRPQDRVSLTRAKAAFQTALPTMQLPAKSTKVADAGGARQGVATSTGGVAQSGVAVAAPELDELDHGAVVIAAITSCTNTSNPSVMIGAGLLAKKAVEKGLTRKPWVKSSLAPGISRRTRIQSGRLRLHHLHRQQRPAAGRSRRGDPREEPRCLFGAQRQSQLRGAHPAGRARQLPGVAAAGGRLRACRLGHHGFDH